MKDELQWTPLLKQGVLEMYSDIFSGIGKFPNGSFKFHLKPNVRPTDMHQDIFLFIYRKLSTWKSGIWNNLEFWNWSKRFLNELIVL